MVKQEHGLALLCTTMKYKCYKAHAALMLLHMYSYYALYILQLQFISSAFLFIVVGLMVMVNIGGPAEAGWI